MSAERSALERASVTRQQLLARLLGACAGGPDWRPGTRRATALEASAAGGELVVVMTPYDKSTYSCSTCILRQAFGAHHPASPRASLAAGSGTDNIPSLRSDTPLPQRISACISCREHSSDQCEAS